MSLSRTPIRFTFTHEADDQDLPPLHVDYAYIDMPADARRVYESMAKDMAYEFAESNSLAVNEAVLSGKLQQIASGFVYTDDGAEHLH